MMDFSEKILKIFPYELDLSDDTFIRITQNNKKGFIDAYGNEIFSLQVKELSNFFHTTDHQYLSFIKTDTGVGIITSEGKITIPAIYDKLHIYNKNQFIGHQDQLWSIIDLKNKTKSLANADFVDFSYGTDIGIIRKDGLYGYIDLNGKPVSQMKFQFATSFSGQNKFALVQDHNQIKAINRKGELITLDGIANPNNLILSATNANGSILLKQEHLSGFFSLNMLYWIVIPQYTYIQPHVLDLDNKINCSFMKLYLIMKITQIFLIAI